MIVLDTEIEGKTAKFGEMMDHLCTMGYCLGGNWDYDKGHFDSILWREGGETIYMRIPFHVIDGMLDEYHALIRFEKPYVIKHVVHIGLDRDENSLLTATGVNQFQEPMDRDGNIHRPQKWEEVGEAAIHEILNGVPPIFS
ncbi:YugN-like family protein [Lederbergia sp. NSJ-179]|uniref:YugN family protein n=1 Tax=Lederbergia sp. NSJ-179 TaxID=2931402 RepID=UPI001FD59C02|nr:YugN family protein [Lederbergia sp. NSJ-179]MCJ7840040.1 YugN-like family protein [Lederbergia sp. NSJ-179]